MSNTIKIGILLSILFTSCTKKFEDYNRNTTGVTNEQLQADFNEIGAFFPSMAQSIQHMNHIAADIEYLTAGSFVGYTMGGFGGTDYRTYFPNPSWDGYSKFDVGYNFTLSPISEIKRRGAEQKAPDFWAIALIIKVAGMHLVTDMYGPVPYSQFGLGGKSVPYDGQDKIYDQFFKELDMAVEVLKNYISKYPGAIPFKKFDNMYDGNYVKWIKYANSLRLRLAMRIVKKDAQRAKSEAEKAVAPSSGGVIISNVDNAALKVGTHMLSVGANEWGDVRSGAAIISYMNGYKDPRIEKLFEKSQILPGKYIGIRVGSKLTSQSDYNKFSTVSRQTWTKASPSVLMNAAEVNFLIAEGILRGWNMSIGNNTQQFYEAGISASFDQWSIAGAANTYINDAISKPEDFVDPILSVNNSPALSNITIKWDDGASNEDKLQRIITQQWLANFPNGVEAWSTFRRTGYPKLFPVVENNSGGTVSSSVQIRRLSYVLTEYNNNKTEVEKGLLLLGGPDNGGTRLWWDVDKPNF